jgi:hypothetical protein
VVTVTAVNTAGSDSQSFTITVFTIPQITSGPVQTVVVGQAYLYDAHATGYPQPTYQLVSGPASLIVNDTTGVVSWTPTASGDFTVTIRATNTAGSTTQTFTITVGSAPQITSAPVTTASLNGTYHYQVQTTAYPTPTYSLPTAPAGMSINPVTGLITWVPTASGDFNVVVQAQNWVSTATQSFIISVQPVNNQIIIEITAPSNGANFAEGSNITIDVGVLEGSSAVSKVNFYAGATLLGEDTSAPYSFTWTNVPVGNYALTAVALDSQNNSTPSNAVNIQVNKAAKKLFLPILIR